MREHDEQQPDQDETPAVTVSAGLATATGSVDGEPRDGTEGSGES